MAYLPDEQNLQTQNNGTPAQGGGQAQQAPITTAPAPTSGGTAKTINQASSNAPAQPFTNLQAYLTANAPQIQAQGDTIAGSLNQNYGDTTKAIDSAKSSFNNDVAAGYTPNDTQVVNNFSADPSKVAADPNAAKTFTGMYNDNYTGPASFEQSGQYGAVNDQVNKNVATAKQVGTPGGLQSYLMGQNPNETQGMATLDSSLLGANPDAVSTVTNAAKQYDQLPSYLTDAVTSADSGVTAAQQAAQAAKQSAQDAATKYSTDFSGRLNGAYDTAAKGAVGYNNTMNALNTKLHGGDFASLTPEEQKLVGYNPADTELFNGYSSIFPTQAQSHPIDFSSYFTPGDNAMMPTPANVVSDGDIANYKALQQLTGNGPNLGFDMPAAHQDGTTASGLPGKLPQFNNEQALQAINSAYGPMFDQLTSAGAAPQNVQDYMTKLATALGQPQPSPMPTTPQPAPGSPGDLGSGFHWDAGSGTWAPTIPLQPATPPPSDVPPPTGGGHHTF